MSNPLHEANRAHWDDVSDEWERGADDRGIWRRCPSEPELVLCDRELAHLRPLSGKRVCVLGSGDNQVVFALAGLGGIVTSVDISQAQLDVAERRAKELGLAITFVRADVTDLSAIESASFDVVYTGGHVAVWVADLRTYYAEAARILRSGGLFLVCEYHPFRRVWAEIPDALTIECPYYHRGPYEYDEDDTVTDGPKTYEFHWTVSDFINAVLAANCRLIEAHEFGDEPEDWTIVPLQGLPLYLLLVSRKEPAAPG